MRRARFSKYSSSQGEASLRGVRMRSFSPAEGPAAVAWIVVKSRAISGAPSASRRGIRDLC